ncbi:hypothetical protein ACSAZL_10815 [Methanosarcina sp. T3]|uniref:hypothetical protein n=1 Tax=Methanosarcina sp. T3 TaxID=3439062 RepID=UPI003F87E0E0
MNKNKRSRLIVVVLMVLFFGIVLVPAAGATSEKSASEKEGNEAKSVDDSRWSEWKQAHTVEVEVTTIYDYKKDGKLKITETYSGEKLKGKYKVDNLTRSQTFSVEDGEEITVSAESGSLKLKPGDQTEIVTRESIVLTPEGEPYQWWTTASLTTPSTASSITSLTTSSTSLVYPQWTYSKFTYLFKTYYKVEDPINLVWEDNSLKAVKNVVLSQKWVDYPVEYTHYLPYPDGSWVAGDGVADSKYRIYGGYHTRFWELPCGDVVSSAHHDDNFFIIPGHQVDGYENAESRVAGFFGTAPGVYWLDNVCYSDDYNACNNGYAAIF